MIRALGKAPGQMIDFDVSRGVKKNAEICEDMIRDIQARIADIAERYGEDWQENPDAIAEVKKMEESPVNRAEFFTFPARRLTQIKVPPELSDGLWFMAAEYEPEPELIEGGAE